MSGNSWWGLYFSSLQHLFSLLLSTHNLLSPTSTLGKELHRSSPCMKDNTLWFCVICLFPNSLKCSCNGWLDSQILIHSLHVTFLRWRIMAYLSCTAVPVLNYSIPLLIVPWCPSMSLFPFSNTLLKQGEHYFSISDGVIKLTAQQCNKVLFLPLYLLPTCSAFDLLFWLVLSFELTFFNAVCLVILRCS